MAIQKVVDLGPLTAYDFAVEGGYQGTEEEYAEYMATITDVIDEAQQSASSASASATQADASATAAADSASDSADSASASASSASAASGSASSASQSASNASASALASAASASESEESAQASAALASAADTSAKAAASSAESSAGSATNAAGSATNAASSATAAAASATGAAGSATSATGSAEDSEAWAVGQRGGVDVESDDETYENNAKYYAEQASGSATASASAKTAAESARDVTIQTKNTAVSEIQTAGTTQVGNVNSAGATQVQAVEDKGDEVLASIPADYSELSDTVDLLSWTKAPVIHNFLSNQEIASFEDGAEDMPLDELKVYIEPVQDLHGYDHPWPAGGGKNLIDYLSCTGEGPRNGTDYIYPEAPSSISGNVLTINQAYSINGGILKGIQHPSIANDTSFVVSFEAKCTGTDITVGYGKYEGGGTNTIETIHATANTWTTITKVYTSQGDSIGLFIQPTAKNTVLEIRNLQLELGSTATAYAPYSNICPITGFDSVKVTRTGKNFVNTALYQFTTITESGLTYTVQNDGTVKVNGTSTLIAGPTLTRRFKLPPGRYVYTQNTSDGIYCVCRYSLQETRGSSFSLSNPFVSTGKEWFYINIYCSEIKEYDNIVLYPQIELGSTATAYEPYKSNTYDIALPTEAGTVYGGELTVNQDGTGELVVDHGMKLLNGSETWTWNGNNSLVSTNITGGVITDSTTQYNRYTQNSTFLDRPWTDRQLGDGTIGMFFGASVLYCKYSKITSGQEAQAFFAANPTTVVYKLATPITYQLTASQVKTLLGTNNICADAGNVDVIYPADTKLYIDKKFAELQALILENISNS